jgi:chromosome segregation ATPase
MRKYSQRILVAALFCLSAAGLPKKEDSPPVDPALLQPKLSQAGIQRINKNINTLDQNLKDLEVNMGAADKNIQTLKAELDALDKLEKEHRDLKKKYQEYLTDAEKKLAKTELELKAVLKSEKDLGGKKGSPAHQKEMLESTQKSKTQLQDWKSDAQVKIRKVNDLIKEVQYNLGQIQGRREVLKVQLNSWDDRKNEFVQLSQTFKSKRTELEKLIEPKP